MDAQSSELAELRARVAQLESLVERLERRTARVGDRGASRPAGLRSWTAGGCCATASA